MSRAASIYIVCSLGMILGAGMIIVGLLFIDRSRGGSGDITVVLPRNLGQVNHASQAIVVLVLGTIFIFAFGWALIELPDYSLTTAVTPKPPQANLTPAVAPRQSTSSFTDSNPAIVVKTYFDAINAHDYAKAWDVGGKNLGKPYGTFVAGYADTRHDTVTILAVNGGTVTVHLVAERTDGQRAVFEGTYAVKQGEITAASLHRA
jgi:hypothetical protein